MQILPLQVLLPLKFNILKGTNPGNLLSTTCWVKMEAEGEEGDACTAKKIN